MEQVVAAVRADLDRDAPARRSEVRWVRLDGLHVTLRFLGATDAARVGAVADAVERAAGRHAPFEAVVAGAGAFPSPSRPRTLWLHVTEGNDALAAVASSVEQEMAQLGWTPTDRPFRAHLTLARADGRREGPLAARLLAAHAAALEVRFAVDRIVLFESVTGRGPARYVPLREARLGA